MAQGIFPAKQTISKSLKHELEGPSSATYPQLSGCLANIQAPHIHISIRVKHICFIQTAHHSPFKSHPFLSPSAIPYHFNQCSFVIYFEIKVLLPCFFFLSPEKLLWLFEVFALPYEFRFLTIFCKKYHWDFFCHWDFDRDCMTMQITLASIAILTTLSFNP